MLSNNYNLINLTGQFKSLDKIIKLKYKKRRTKYKILRLSLINKSI